MVNYCRNCAHASEDIVGGSWEPFCASPNTDFLEGQFNSGVNWAEHCDFYEGSSTVHYVSGGWNGQTYVTALCGAEISFGEASSLITNCPKCQTQLKHLAGYK